MIFAPYVQVLATSKVASMANVTPIQLIVLSFSLKINTPVSEAMATILALKAGKMTLASMIYMALSKKMVESQLKIPKAIPMNILAEVQ